VNYYEYKVTNEQGLVSLHGFFSIASPLHRFPVLQVLDRKWKPSPQAAEHDDQLPHGFQYIFRSENVQEFHKVEKVVLI